MSTSGSATTRTFTSPSGRGWTATIAFARVPDGGAVAQVLRFTSEPLVLDLGDWPPDWAESSDDAVVDLLRKAQPPGLGLPSDRSAHRPPAAH